MRQKSETKAYRLGMRMVLCIIALSGTGAVLVAQQKPDQAAPQTDSQDAKPTVLVLPSYSQNIALLGTDQRYMDLGTLEARRRRFFMYGMGVSESYVDNFKGNSGAQGSSQFLWSPRVAIIDASNHSSFSLQYAPSVLQSTSGPSNRQVFQSGSISLGQPITRNWMLQLSSTNTYGTDATRLLSPLAFDVNKGVPVADPSSAAFQLNAGKLFTTSDIIGLNWQRTASQSMSFSVGESYLSSLDVGPSNRTTSANVSYAAAISPLTAFTVEGNYYHQTFSLRSCDGYGFSLGISREVGRHINLTAAGGPEFETGSCNKTLSENYIVSMSYILSRRSRVGLAASRSYLPNYLANTQWSDTATVSYAKQFTETVGLILNSGYDRSNRAQAGLGAYVGYFVGAELSWKLSRTIALGTNYRRFEQVSGGPTQRQNVGLISLAWNPLPMGIVK